MAVPLSPRSMLASLLASALVACTTVDRAPTTAPTGVLPSAEVEVGHEPEGATEDASVGNGALVLTPDTVRLMPRGETRLGVGPASLLRKHRIAWASSDSTIVRVTPDGAVVALRNGIALISAVAGPFNGKSAVVVGPTEDDPPEPEPIPEPEPEPEPEPGPEEPPPAPEPPQGPTRDPQGQVGDVELPRAFVQVQPVPSATGRVIRVPVGGNLQAALNGARSGDHILLAPGGVWRGSFVLPARASDEDGWVVLGPDIPGGPQALPSGRMTPEIAAQLRLPRLENASTAATLKAGPGSARWRVVGLEVALTGSPAASPAAYDLVSIGDGSSAQKSLESIPSYIVLDRMYVHGRAGGLQIRRCVALHGRNDAVIDSWISECTNSGFDAQAVWGWNGPGPHRITNNYLEASGENVGFGGAVPGIAGLIPSDIEIRGNHIAKPLSWKGGPYLIKNLVEFKNGQRVLIEGNLIEGVWTNGQQGFAVVLTPGAERGRCSWCTVRDLTFRRNLVREVGGGINLSANPHGQATPAARIAIVGNVFERVNQKTARGAGRVFQVGGNGLDGLIIENNTALGQSVALILLARQTRLVVRYNILGGRYGIMGDGGQPNGVATLDHQAPGWTYVGNVHVGVSTAQVKNYPPHNTHLRSLAQVGFADVTEDDYRLLSSSPFRRMAPGGADVGADIGAIAEALAGVPSAHAAPLARPYRQAAEPR